MGISARWQKKQTDRGSTLCFLDVRHAVFGLHSLPRRALLIALLLTLNQRKNPFIKATDLARYEYQFLVLARKLSSPNMRRKHVLAAGLTQFVQGLAKRRSVTLNESFFALKIC